MFLRGNYYRPQRSWGKVIFLHLFVILFTGGHAWLLRRGCWRGMHGCSWEGHVWLFLGGMHGCSQGGMCGCSGGAFMVALGGGGGHAWLLWGCAWLLLGGLQTDIIQYNTKCHFLSRPSGS